MLLGLSQLLQETGLQEWLRYGVCIDLDNFYYATR